MTKQSQGTASKTMDRKETSTMTDSINTGLTNQVESGMDLQGNLQGFNIPDIFQLLTHSRKNGTLGIQRESDVVMVYFQDGQIIYAYGPRQTYHLGQLLKERNKITAVQLSEAVKLQTEGGKNSSRLGQILQEMSAVDRNDIAEVVTEQVEELLYSMLAWDTGSFKFYENQFPTKEEVTISLSTENIILEGLRRMDEMNHLRDSLPALDAVLGIASTVNGHMIDVALNPEEWNILALVDGRRTIKDIVEVSNLTEIMTLKKIAALKLAGLLTEIKVTENSNSSQTEVAGETKRLETMMTRLAGLLEEFLQGSGSPAPDVTGAPSVGGSTRMVGDKPLTEILSETEKAGTISEVTTNKKKAAEDKLWNEFTN